MIKNQDEVEEQKAEWVRTRPDAKNPCAHHRDREAVAKVDGELLCQSCAWDAKTIRFKIQV